jgi:hypothetical protein
MKMTTPTSYAFMCSLNTEMAVLHESCLSNCLQVFYLTDQG